MRTIRAKFQVESVTEYYWGGSKQIKMSARYDEAIPEDRQFAEATPSGSLEMMVDNPAALELLKPGQAFYLDFVPTEDNKPE